MEEQITVLVVEDEENIARVLTDYLRSRGYAVFSAASAGDALELFRREPVSLVLLDLMLPDRSGEEVCRIIRQTSSVPVIMLTAKVEEADLVSGLDMGADDYVTKPFSLRALAARMEAVLRRCTAAPGPCAGLEIEPDSCRVKKRGKPVSLTPNEYRLLCALARHSGRVFGREELIALALGPEYDGFDRTVDTHIKNLRRKIEDDPRHPRYIRTVRGIGYRFEGDD